MGNCTAQTVPILQDCPAWTPGSSAMLGNLVRGELPALPHRLELPQLRARLDACGDRVYRVSGVFQAFL